MKVAAIVLAAGLSRRMGQAKLLLPWGETTVLGATLAAIAGAEPKQLIVVTGAYADDIRPIAEAAGATVVHNADFATGEMLSSIQAGLAVVAEGHAAAIQPADMPLLTTATVRTVFAALESAQPSQIVLPTFEGRRGHPRLFSADLLPALRALKEKERPRDVVRRRSDLITEVIVDDHGVLVDVDTPDRYNQWCPR